MNYKENDKQMPERPDIYITVLTLSSFVAGMLSAFNIILSLALYLPIAIYPYYKKINHLSPLQIGYCTITTYIFGVIDIYSLLYFDIFSLCIWVNTIRFYFEFQLNNCYHYQKVNWSSFLIYHSRQYFIASVVLVIQHLLTKYYLEFQYKTYHVMVIPAFIITMLGLLMRIMAFFTAKHNFTHKISYQKKRNHQLVTHGIYKYLRHPSYTGFFYLSIFSMIMIGNFITAVAYSIALIKFFRDRLEDEQQQLFIFFPGKYRHYYQRTYTFIPFLIKYQ